MKKHPRPFPDVVEWRGWIVRIKDGDTVVVRCDIGFRIHHEFPVRVRDLYAPETRGEERVAGEAAKTYLQGLAPPGTPVLVRTTKMERSFNRYVGDVEVWRDEEWVDLATAVIAAGHGARTDE